MGTVTVDKSMSLDGFITGPNPGPDNGLGDGGERIFAWMETGEADGAAARPNESYEEFYGGVTFSGRPVIMGRKSFDVIDSPDGWVFPDGTGYRGPVFVLTSRPMENETKGVTPFVFVSDGIESAVRQARGATGDKDIGLHGATVAQQALRAGLLDEIHLHVVPVLLSVGTRLFDHLGVDHIELEQVSVREAPGVTHLTYRVIR